MKLTKGEAERMYDVLKQEQIDEIIQSLKLRELIEKRIKIDKTSVRDYEQEMLLKELLKESKNHAI